MEITKDMREAAKEAADYCGIGAYSTMRQFIEDVAANAIRDERERCAKLCEEWTMGTPYSNHRPTHAAYIPSPAWDGFHQGSGYAALIRNGVNSDEN